MRELALLDVRLSSLRICQLVELFFFSNSKSVGSFIFFLQEYLVLFLFDTAWQLPLCNNRRM